MDETALITEGTEQIFRHRRSELIVGLTGRTGSGCSTIAHILSCGSYTDIPLPNIPNPPGDHEDRKHRIVNHWLREHWAPFIRINVSQVIALFAIEEAESDLFAFIKRHLSGANPLTGIASELATARQNAANSRSVLNSLRGAQPDEVHRAYKFYFEDLPRIARIVKDNIYGFGPGAYTSLFQSIGDNLRKSGRPFDSTARDGGLFMIPKTVEQLIRLGKVHNKVNHSDCNYFVIDALRHPFEILFLRDRLPHFYVIGTTTDDPTRRSRLTDLNYTKTEIDSLDAKEYPSVRGNVRGYDRFISQDIQGCLENSDIFVSNSSDERELARYVCRYVALMQHPGLVTPTPIERCMQAAFAARLNSGCISRQVGAVATDGDYSIKAVGWNDVPRGQVPCLLRYSYDMQKGLGDIAAFSQYEKHSEFKKSVKDNVPGSESEQIGGRHITYCFRKIYNIQKAEKNQVHTRSLHAEENAFLQISKYGGQGLEGGHLFTTASPCELCAKKAAQLGIVNVYYIDPYPGITREHIFGYDHRIPKLVLFGGVIGAAYHRLYSSVMPYKDELAAIVTKQASLRFGSA